MLAGALALAAATGLTIFAGVVSFRRTLRDIHEARGD